MGLEHLHPGFDGNYGWISVTELDGIDNRSTLQEMKLKLLEEYVAFDGTIFFLLQKIKGDCR